MNCTTSIEHKATNHTILTPYVSVKTLTYLYCLIKWSEVKTGPRPNPAYKERANKNITTLFSKYMFTAKMKHTELVLLKLNN